MMVVQGDSTWFWSYMINSGVGSTWYVIVVVLVHGGETLCLYVAVVVYST